MKDQSSLKSVINSVNTGTSIPALKLVKDNPELAAMISKLVKPTLDSTFDINKKTSHYNLDQSQIQQVSDTIKSNISDSENILQLFPDIELAIQIMVSSILSPKDMVNTDILYQSQELVVASELTMKLNDIVSTHMTKHYKMLEKLPEILRDTLFNTGSFVEAVLPESILDEVINNNVNVSTEAFSELFTEKNDVVNLGILGNSGKDGVKRSAVEALIGSVVVDKYNPCLDTGDDKLTDKLKSLVEISDNFKFLKLPKVTEALTKSKLKNIIRNRPSLEDGKFTNQQLANKLYKNRPSQTEQFLVLPSTGNAKRKSVGRPLVMRLPSESVIPVYIPGNETKHVGYFVLVDVDGNPVTINANTQAVGGLSSLQSNSNENSTSLSSMLIKKASTNLVNNQVAPTIDQITKVYSSIVEKDLIERLNNGLYKNKVKVADNEDVYRIMLARTLADQFTRLIYIPEELVTYFAFKYHANGVGKSYLDDIKILTSLRAIILFSKVMALTKNSIALTHVNMTLDPNDPDPQKTIELATHEVAKTRQQYFPLGINSPVDLVDWIQRAGFEFTFEGHPGLPETKFDFQTKNIQHNVPDSELDELLRRQTYMSFGLSPEMVDNGFDSDFATTVIANNILLSKRVMQLQAIFTVQLTDLARKIISNDPILLDELKSILSENKEILERSVKDDEKALYKETPELYIDDVLERYVENLELTLPKPDITSIETQSDAFDQYVESLEKSLDAWINADSVESEISGDISEHVETIRSVVKNYYIRRWMSNNGFMSELSDIVTTNEDGDPTLDIYDVSKSHVEGLVKSSIKFIDSMNKVKKDSDSKLEEINAEPEEVEEENNEEE